MNILLLSNLYPAFENQSVNETSYALHNFTKEWVKDNIIIVVRLLFPSYRNFIKGKSIYSKFPYKFVLDSITIFNIRCFKIPIINIILKMNKIKNELNILNFFPDLILSHMSDSYIIATELSNYFKSKLVLGVHNSDLKVIKNQIFQKSLLHSSKIACRSFSIYKKLINYFPQYENKMFIANSGIDPIEIENHDFFINKINNWKNKNKILFITVAILQKLKNIDITLDVLSNLTDFEWEYIIIGDGEEKIYLLDKVEKLKMIEKVHFVGEKTREEVLQYLKLSDIFIMVSAPETFGLAYLEAMAKCNIIIGCKGWGIDGIIVNGKNGFLAEARNIDQLSSIIQNIYFSSIEYKRMILLEMEHTIRNNTNESAANNYLKAIF